MINVVERANTTDLKIFQMVGSALMTETRRSQAEINADSQRHYGGLAELPTDKKASENFHRPAYQACELIRKSSELFSESSEE